MKREFRVIEKLSSTATQFHMFALTKVIYFRKNVINHLKTIGIM